MTRIETKRSKRGVEGFTFMEIVIALAVMASAAAIIIGMQGAALRRTMRDSNAQQALLIARRIMASIEAMNPKNFNLSSQDNQPVSSLFQTLGLPPTAVKGEDDPLKSLMASITVDDLPIPLLQKEALMKRIALRISWGAGFDDALEILYLMPDPGTP